MLSPLKKTDPDWFEFDWLDQLVNEWRPGEIVGAGALRRPTVPNGFMLKCTVAGQTRAREPAWPSEVGATKAEAVGGVTWQVVAWAAPDLPVIESCSYAISPAGITNVSDAIDAALLSTRVRLDAGAAALGVYTITATMTDSLGEQYVDSDTVEVVE